METIGNITDEAVQKYIKEQAEESRKEDSRSTAFKWTSNKACDAALRGEQQHGSFGGAKSNHQLNWWLVT